MASSLSNLVINLSEGIQKITDTMIKNVKLAELNIGIATVFLNTNFKDDVIEYKCLYYNKNYQQKL